MPEENIVVADAPHIALPPETNQNDVRSRINDLIARPPDQPGEGEQPKDSSSEVVSQSDEDTDPDTADLEKEELGLSDAELNARDSDNLDEDDQEIDQEQVETLDAKTLAEKLGLPVDELYAMKFPYGENGESITLGELKDAGIRAKSIDAESENLSQERNSFINDQMKSRSELQNIVSLLPEVPEELMQQAQRQQASTIQSERVSLLKVLPDWQDPGIEQLARSEMMDSLSAYGFSSVEFSYMLDHRLIKYIYDNTRLRAKMVEPKAQASALKKTTKRKPQSRQTRRRQQVDQANKIGSKDIRGAINALLPRP